MMKRYTTSAQAIGNNSREQRSILDSLSIERPQISCRKRVSNKMAILSLAVGYLGMVAVLASVPAWNQMLPPYQASSLSCTDFGGGR